MISLLKKSSTQIFMKNITHLIRGYIAVVVVSPSGGGVDDQVKYCRPKIKLLTMIYILKFFNGVYSNRNTCLCQT